MIHIMLALASGSSRVSRFSQSVAMMLSYLFGYFRNMSLMTTTASYSTASIIFSHQRPRGMSYLDDVVDFGLNEIQQRRDTSLRTLFNLTGVTSDVLI